MTKGEILKEVATALFLLMTFSKPTPGMAWDEVDEKILENMQKKAEEALRIAEPVIGILNAKTVQEFIDTRREKFVIPCGAHLVKGDKIRFEENVFNNKCQTPRFVGQRVICAEVTEIQHEGPDQLLNLRIIWTEGTWPFNPGQEIRRNSHLVRNAKRIPWSDEGKRPKPFVRQQQAYHLPPNLI